MFGDANRFGLLEIVWVKGEGSWGSSRETSAKEPAGSVCRINNW